MTCDSDAFWELFKITLFPAKCSECNLVVIEMTLFWLSDHDIFWELFQMTLPL